MVQESEGMLIITAPDGGIYTVPETALAAYAIAAEAQLVVGGPDGRLYAIPRAELERFAVSSEVSDALPWAARQGSPAEVSDALPWASALYGPHGLQGPPGEEGEVQGYSGMPCPSMGYAPAGFGGGFTVGAGFEASTVGITAPYQGVQYMPWSSIWLTLPSSRRMVH